VDPLTGSGGIQGSDVYRGGQLGIHRGGSVVSGNSIHDNNTEDFDPSWEAGGLKSIASGMLIEGNDVYGNGGPGIWFDLGASDTTIVNNRVHDNEGAGIYYEISSRGLISGNVVWQNGGAQPPGWTSGVGILLNSSGNTEVTDNIVAWNDNGIVFAGQDRGDRPADAFQGNYIHDNVITEGNTSDSMALAWMQDWSGPLFDAASGNHGSDNRYWFPGPEGNAVRFWWKRGFTHLAKFNATPGDEGGSYLTDAEKDALLSSACVPTQPPAAPG
jgi:parallel beta-helix repeat protein